MRTRIAWSWLAVASFAVAGCATLAAGGARNLALQQSLRDYRFPVACEALWADALTVIASQGFELVGSDRELAGQSKQGFISNALNAGHSTTLDDHGVYESATDFNSARLRYEIKGTTAGKDGCLLVITSIQQDRATMQDTRQREYEQELTVLSRVAPGEAARIEEAVEKAAK
jgi:hypothetical protein